MIRDCHSSKGCAFFLTLTSSVFFGTKLRWLISTTHQNGTFSMKRTCSITIRKAIEIDPIHGIQRKKDFGFKKPRRENLEAFSEIIPSNKIFAHDQITIDFNCKAYHMSIFQF